MTLSLASQATIETSSEFYQEGIDVRPRAPADEETGIPLLIAPHTSMDNLPESLKNIHHGYYPRLNPLFKTVGGAALRVARLQVVPMKYHNLDTPVAFHTIYGDGVPLPESEPEQMGATILDVAGYVPDHVVDTTRGEPYVRPSTAWEKKFLMQPSTAVPIDERDVKKYRDEWMPGAMLDDAKKDMVKMRTASAELHYRNLYYGHMQITRFATEYVFGQDITQVSRSKLLRFLNSGRPEDGLDCIDELCGLAAETAAVKGVRLTEMYQRLQQRKALRPAASQSAAETIKYSLGTKKKQTTLLPKLWDAARAVDMVA